MSLPERPPAVAILAAGLGTRMRSRLPKVLHPLCGRPMLSWVLDAARDATGARPLVVISPATEAVRDAFASEADFTVQEKPNGTGDAVRVALAALTPATAELVVLSGDVPLVDPELIAELVEERRARSAVMALVSSRTLDPTGFGRIVRSDGGEGDEVLRIVEEKDATAEEREIDEINAGLYAFDAHWLRRRLPDLRPSEASGEIYLTELVALARADHRPVAALEAGVDPTLDGINDRSQLAFAAALLRDRINEAHMVGGVTMVDPTTTYIDADVEIASDVVIEPNVILRGRTRIGEGSRIGPGSQIIDSAIGSHCTVWASVVESSEVEDDVQIGPFSHLRPGASIGRGAKLGNYAEVKASRIGPGVQQHHFSYVGDAEVGARTNIGAGTITCNYDGRRKHRTTIGEDVFVGSDSMLVAPVTLGDGSRTGAGSVVTHDVPAGRTAFGVPARVRQETAEARDAEHAPRDADPASSEAAVASADADPTA